MPLIRVRALALAACACLAATAPARPAAAGETIRVGGTGSATELLRRLGAAFKAERGVEVEVIPSLWSSGAIRALGDGALDVAVSGRDLEPQERARGLSIAFTARTPFVLATSHPRPNGLTIAEIAGAFQSVHAVWSDGTPMHVILRPLSESDTGLMAELFPSIVTAMANARLRPDIPVAPTDQDNADMAEQMPGSLIGSTLTQIELEKRDLRLVPIEGVAPTIANFERGTYHYAKLLHFIVLAQPGAPVESFIAFLSTPTGQKALHDARAL